MTRVGFKKMLICHFVVHICFCLIMLFVFVLFILIELAELKLLSNSTLKRVFSKRIIKQKNINILAAKCLYFQFIQRDLPADFSFNLFKSSKVVISRINCQALPQIICANFHEMLHVKRCFLLAFTDILKSTLVFHFKVMVYCRIATFECNLSTITRVSSFNQNNICKASKGEQITFFNFSILGNHTECRRCWGIMCEIPL